MMNVNMANTGQVLQKTASVGFLPNVAPKVVTQRDDSRHTFLDEMEGHGDGLTSEDHAPNPLTPSPQQMATAARNNAGAAAQGAGFQSKNRISQNTTMNTSWQAGEASEEEEEQQAGIFGAGQRPPAQQTQQQGTQRSELWYSLASQSGWAQETEKNQKSGPSAKMEKPKFDTGRLIQLQFLANKGANLVANVVMSAAEKALAAKEFFLRNFFRLVDTEYKQYVKSDDAMYSRKNLREILSALGETINPFSAKNKKWRENKGLEPKGFDKLSQRAAGRTLKIFDEVPEPETQQPEPLEIVW
jgi:hypothetical protein